MPGRCATWPIGWCLSIAGRVARGGEERSYARRELSHRRTGPRRAGPGKRVALCLGRRLSRSDPPPASQPGRLSPPADACGPSPRRGRYGAVVGAAVRPAGRTRVDRQEHVAGQPAIRQLATAGRALEHGRVGLRHAERGRPLRLVSGLHRRLSVGRTGGALSPRHPQVCELSHHRVARSGVGRTALERARAGCSVATHARRSAPGIAARRRPRNRPSSPGRA